MFNFYPSLYHRVTATHPSCYNLEFVLAEVNRPSIQNVRPMRERVIYVFLETRSWFTGRPSTIKAPWTKRREIHFPHPLTLLTIQRRFALAPTTVNLARNYAFLRNVFCTLHDTIFYVVTPSPSGAPFFFPPIPPRILLYLALFSPSFLFNINTFRSRI